MISTDFSSVKPPTATPTTSTAASLHSATEQDNDLTGDTVCWPVHPPEKCTHTAIPNVICTSREGAGSSIRNSYSSESQHTSASGPVVPSGYRCKGPTVAAAATNNQHSQTMMTLPETLNARAPTQVHTHSHSEHQLFKLGTCQ